MGLVGVVIRLRQVTIAAAAAGRCISNCVGRCDFIVAILDIRSPGAAGIVRFRGAGGDGTQDGGVDDSAYRRGIGEVG